MNLSNDLRLRQIEKEVTPYSAKVACEVTRYLLRCPKGSPRFEDGERSFALIEKAMALTNVKLRTAVFDYLIGQSGNYGSILMIGHYGEAAKSLLPELQAMLAAKKRIIHEREEVLFSAIAQIDTIAGARMIRDNDGAFIREAILFACAYAPKNSRYSMLTAFAKSGFPSVEKEANFILTSTYQGKIHIPKDLAVLMLPKLVQGSMGRFVQTLGSLKPVRLCLVNPLHRLGVKLGIAYAEFKGARDVPDSLKAL